MYSSVQSLHVHYALTLCPNIIFSHCILTVSIVLMHSSVQTINVYCILILSAMLIKSRVQSLNLHCINCLRSLNVQ